MKFLIQQIAVSNVELRSLAEKFVAQYKDMDFASPSELMATLMHQVRSNELDLVVGSAQGVVHLTSPHGILLRFRTAD